MLPITLANLQSFCRICLRELVSTTATYKPDHEIRNEKLDDFLLNIAGVSTEHKKMYLFPSKVCHSCYIKMIALDTFRQKCIISLGVLRLTVEQLKGSTVECEMLRLKRICRTCLKQENDVYSMEHNPELLSNIEYCCGLQQRVVDDCESLLVDDSRYPRILCGKCYSKLKTFMSFKSLAEQTEIYLRGLVDDECGIDVKNEAIELETENIEQPKQLDFVQEFHVNEDCATPMNVTELYECDNELVVKTEYSGNEADLGEDIPNNEPLIDTFEVVKIEKNPLFDVIQSEETPFDLSESIMLTGKSVCSDSETDSVHTETIKEKVMKNSKPKTKEVKLKDTKNESKAQVKVSAKHKKCTQCEKTFYKLFMLEAHVKSVHEGVERPFICELCPSSFRQYSALDRHRTLLHMPKVPLPKDIDVFAPQKSNIHVCMTCLRQFKRKDILEQHINTAHTVTELRPFKCKFCQKGFGSKRTMLRHEQNHSQERPFACEFCPKRYNTKVELTSHMHRHTTSPDLLCPICKRGKKSTEELQKHIAMHEASRQHQCPTCGRVFTKMFHLREHESAVHLKLRPFKCSFCEKNFATRRTQKEHEQLHDPTSRPVLCELCTMNFKNQSTLSRHMKKDHNQLPKKLREQKNMETAEMKSS